MSEDEQVTRPPHYTKGKIEVIDFITDQEFGYLAGNVVKYMSRYRHKGSGVQDLEKAKWYIEKLIFEIKGENLLNTGPGTIAYSEKKHEEV